MSNITKDHIQHTIESLTSNRRQVQSRIDRLVLELREIDTNLSEADAADAGGYWEDVEGRYIAIRTLGDDYLLSAMRTCVASGMRPLELALLAAEGQRRRWDIQTCLTGGARGGPRASVTRDLPELQDPDPTLADATKPAHEAPDGGVIDLTRRTG